MISKKSSSRKSRRKCLTSSSLLSTIVTWRMLTWIGSSRPSRFVQSTFAVWCQCVQKSASILLEVATNGRCGCVGPGNGASLPRLLLQVIRNSGVQSKDWQEYGVYLPVPLFISKAKLSSQLCSLAGADGQGSGDRVRLPRGRRRKGL